MANSLFTETYIVVSIRPRPNGQVLMVMGITTWFRLVSWLRSPGLVRITQYWLLWMYVIIPKLGRTSSDDQGGGTVPTDGEIFLKGGRGPPFIDKWWGIFASCYKTMSYLCWWYIYNTATWGILAGCDSETQGVWANLAGEKHMRQAWHAAPLSEWANINAGWI